MGEFVDDDIILERIIAIWHRSCPYIHPTGPRLATTYMVSVRIVIDFVDNVEGIGACDVDVGSAGRPEGGVVGMVEGIGKGLGDRCGLGRFVGDVIVAAT